MVPPASHKLTGVRGTQDPSQVRSLPPTGLSPPPVALSNAFGSALVPSCWSYNPILSKKKMVWALPASLATTTGISFDFSSSGY